MKSNFIETFCANLKEIPIPNIDQDNIIEKFHEIKAILKEIKENGNKEKLQNVLYNYIMEKHVRETIDSLNSMQRTLYESTSSAFASEYLKVIPNRSDFVFDDNTFQIALRMRFGIKLKGFHGAIKCPFCQLNIDKQGHHFAIGCRGVENRRIENHNTLVTKLAACVRYCGDNFIKEPPGLFLSTDGITTSNEKPDLAIYSATMNNQGRDRELLDITITSPFTSHGAVKEDNSLKAANNPAKSKGVQAEKAYKRKIVKYNDELKLKNKSLNLAKDGIIPIVFDISGLIHPKSLFYIEKTLAARGAKYRKLKPHQISTFIMRILNCWLIKCYSETVANKMDHTFSNIGNARLYKNEEINPYSLVDYIQEHNPLNMRSDATCIDG